MTAKTVLIFTLITTIILFAILIPLVYFVMQFIQNGGFDGISELVTGASSGQVLNTSLGQTQGLLDELLH